MSNKLISVVIPAYNAEKTVQSAIKSVLLQDYPHIELIVVDDGSIDKTVSVVWSMRQQCSQRNIKIHLISQQNNGVSHARNRGFKEATGEYVAFLDADDQWLANKLSIHAAHLEASESLGLSFARVNFISKQGKIRKSSAYINGQLRAEDCFSMNPTISPSNWVVRKKAYQEIKGFNETMTHAEDQDFVIRLLSSTSFQIKCVDHVLVNYSTSEKGLSADIDAMYVGWLMLFKTIRNGDNKTHLYSQYHSEYCLFLSKRAIQVSTKVLKSWKYFFKAVVSEPLIFIKKPSLSINVFISLMHYSYKNMLNTVSGTKVTSQMKEVKNV